MALNEQHESAAYREFEAEAKRGPKDTYTPVKFGGFEWLENEAVGARIPGYTISELTERPPCPLKIILAPLDIPHAQTVDDLLALYRLYSIPGAFVSERLHQVAHSFGSSEKRDGSSYSWFHFLCKNVPVEEINGAKHIVNHNKRDGKDLSQADFSWVRSAYCLVSKPPTQGRTWPEVTLLVFSGELSLWGKFDALANKKPWQEILQDPCCLLGTVFEVMYARIDRIAWDLAQVYSQEEEKILRSADHPGSAADSLDFVGLHILSKHQIYLLEATEAAMATLDEMALYHERASKPGSTACRRTQNVFRHRRTLFKSTDLRLKSLEKRTQNIINLLFNLVTQADSRVMKADSSSMKIIAVMTLVSLPCTAVATVFSTPFFYLHGDSDDAGPLRMSPYFWLIWVFAIPLTVVVVFAWHKYQKRLQLRILGAVQPVPFGGNF